MLVATIFRNYIIRFTNRITVCDTRRTAIFETTSPIVIFTAITARTIVITIKAQLWLTLLRYFF